MYMTEAVRQLFKENYFDRLLGLTDTKRGRSPVVCREDRALRGRGSPDVVQSPVEQRDRSCRAGHLSGNRWTGAPTTPPATSFAACRLLHLRRRGPPEDLDHQLVTTTFEYDGEGRVKKGNEIYAMTPSATRRRIRRHGVHHRHPAIRAGPPGSTRLILNAQAAAPSARLRPTAPNSPAPAPTATTPATGLPLFTGQMRDPESAAGTETGLDYFNARYFWATLGRFTSPDAPFADQYPEDPQSWNLYSYVRNNPLIYTDPSGKGCVYLNKSGTDIGNVDDQITSEQCGKTGGYWIDGTFTEARFAHGSLILGGTTDGQNRTSASYGLGPDPGLMALQLGTRIAEPGVKLAAVGTAIVMGGAFGGAAYGALAGGTALNAVSIPLATLPPLVSNPTLHQIVSKLFQATDRLPGGTAGAVRYEIMTGDLMSPTGHSKKAQEVIVALTNLLKSGSCRSTIKSPQEVIQE